MIKMKILLVIFISYFLGAIPNGYIFVQRLRDLDIRKYGSGNVGATNVARLLGFKFGILVAALDILKGFLAVSFAAWLFPGEAVPLVLAGLLAVIGHSFSVFLNFSGGKGVATTVGVILRIYPLAVLVIVVVWLVVTVISRYVSLGSMLGAISLPVIFLIRGKGLTYVVFGLLIALFILYNHRGNIQRLMAGEENKLGESVSPGKGES
ncbi:MAG: glycerol-3-phosphate 1-O-acyltransferase PlsY [Halanaerobiales bacterium]